MGRFGAGAVSVALPADLAVLGVRGDCGSVAGHDGGFDELLALVGDEDVALQIERPRLRRQALLLRLPQERRRRSELRQLRGGGHGGLCSGTPVRGQYGTGRDWSHQ